MSEIEEVMTDFIEKAREIVFGTTFDDLISAHKTVTKALHEAYEQGVRNSLSQLNKGDPEVYKIAMVGRLVKAAREVQEDIHLEHCDDDHCTWCETLSNALAAFEEEGKE